MVAEERRYPTLLMTQKYLHGAVLLGTGATRFATRY